MNIIGGFQSVKIWITKLWIRDFLLYVTNISITCCITLLLQGPIRSPFSLLLLCLRWERKPSLNISSISCTSQTGMYVCRSYGSQIVTSWSSQTLRLKRTACLVRDIEPVSLVQLQALSASIQRGVRVPKQQTIILLLMVRFLPKCVCAAWFII